jgi:hypothetical protein
LASSTIACGTLFSVGDALGAFFAGRRQFGGDAFFGGSHLCLATVSRGQAVRDPLGALVERFHHRRPHEFHRDEHQDEEDHELNKQGCVQIHGKFLLTKTDAEPGGSAIQNLSNGVSIRRGTACECEQHGDTDTDQECRVDQASQQEHLGLQGVHQFRLTCRSFQVFTAHQSDTDTCADSTQADDQTASQCNVRIVSHYIYSKS